MLGQCHESLSLLSLPTHSSDLEIGRHSASQSCASLRTCEGHTGVIQGSFVVQDLPGIESERYSAFYNGT